MVSGPIRVDIYKSSVFKHLRTDPPDESRQELGTVWSVPLLKESGSNLLVFFWQNRGSVYSAPPSGRPCIALDRQGLRQSCGFLGNGALKSGRTEAQIVPLASPFGLFPLIGTCQIG